MEEIKTLNEIIVDDGYIEVPIKNTLGKQIGVFYFNPTDVGIISRFNEIGDKMDEVVKPLADIGIAADGTATSDSDTAALKEAESRLFELVDYLFGGNLSEAFFGTMNPFSPVNGKFYCENVLNAVGTYINKQFEAETKKINARVDKYTHGYRTGKHKDARK